MSVWSRIKQSWKPAPIDPPTVDPDLQHLHPLTRSAESIRYSILRIEWWISKGGVVREWLRHNARCAVFLGIPAVMVVPIVTFILFQIVRWTAMLNSITRHLILLPMLALVLVLIVAVVKSILR